MTKLLITGFSGFVSLHYMNLLRQKGDDVQVLGLDINTPDFEIVSSDKVKISFKELNLLDKNLLKETLLEFQPDQILHLASFSSVAYSWKFPEESFLNNTNIFLNLIETVRSTCPKCRILSIGSSEQYGKVQESGLPLSESSVINPISPYAVARVSQEMLGKIYVEGYGMDIVFTRSFNHIGPFQRDNFVVSSFAKKVIAIANGNCDETLKTGDLSIIRDFVDVRDVAEAYYLVLYKGKSGEVYNICSGKGTTLNEILNTFIELAGVQMSYETDKSFVRPNDNPIIIGSSDKIVDELGWKKTIELPQSLEDIYRYWENSYLKTST
jgi:GDP-4-dehydro-6-deoxy-D-mannose reductase